MATSKHRVLSKIPRVYDNDFYTISIDFCSRQIFVCRVRNNFKRENKPSVIFYRNEFIVVSPPRSSGRNSCFGTPGHGFDLRVAGEIFSESPGARCKPVINHQNYPTDLVTTPVCSVTKRTVLNIPRHVKGLVPVVCSVFGQ